MAPLSKFRYATNKLFIAGFVFTITVGGGGQACLCGWSGGDGDRDGNGCGLPYETLCDDGLDNDEDGFIDCQDSDCAGDPACVEAACDNNVDDDYDGLVDCADPDCSDTTDCSERCDDDVDNDLDGLVDCADPDCSETTDCHERCDDDVDNDLDGLMDCVDPDCFGDAICALTTARVTLLQTAGLRSHANGVGCLAEYRPFDATGLDPVLGGYARLAGTIAEIRATGAASGTPVLTLDTGDFTMGGPHDFWAEDPLQLRFFQRAGYDAVALGGAELAWSFETLAAMLTSAASPLHPPAFTVPVLASNLLFDPNDERDDALEALMQSGELREAVVYTLSNGLVVGLLGRVGPGVASDAYLNTPLPVSHPVYWQARVDRLRADFAPDLVVLLTHGGLDDDGNDSDAELAVTVHGIDIIATAAPAGSTEAVQVVDTIIFPSAADGTSLSRLDWTYETEQGVLLSFTHQLRVIDSTSALDASMQQEVDRYTAALDTQLLTSFAVESASPVVETSTSLAQAPLSESRLGNLCADALRAAATNAVQDTADATPFAVALLPDRMLAQDLHVCSTGVVTFADLYAVLPHGRTPATDQDPRWPGWPLVSFYLTAPELRNVAEVLSTDMALFSESLWMSYSGIRITRDLTRSTGAKVQNVYLCGNTLPAGPPHFGDADLYSELCTTHIVGLVTPGYTPDHTTLYRVVTDLHTAVELSWIGAVTYPFTLKDAAGQPLGPATAADLLPHRIDGAVEAGVQELKAWQALYWFVSTHFTDEGGLSDLRDIPVSKYGPLGTALGRI